MKQTIFILLVLIGLFGCKSIDLPTIEQSERSIAEYSKGLESTERVIDAQNKRLPSGNDIILKLNSSIINRLVKNITNSRQDDINLIFKQTKKLISEKKNILGLEYNNYLNIDTGNISIDIKSLTIDKINNKLLNGTLEIEGMGSVKVTGSHTGISASSTPEVELYLKESITFESGLAKNGNLILSPKPKDMKLKLKFNVKLLEWKVPVSREVPLKLTELLKPVNLPLMFDSEMQLPVPADEFKKQNLEMVPFTLKFKDAAANAGNEAIEYRAQIEIQRK